jgi:hypothetical protein
VQSRALELLARFPELAPENVKFELNNLAAHSATSRQMAENENTGARPNDRVPLPVVAAMLNGCSL